MMMMTTMLLFRRRSVWFSLLSDDNGCEQLDVHFKPFARIIQYMCRAHTRGGRDDFRALPNPRQ